jgi:hypothetical protein
MNKKSEIQESAENYVDNFEYGIAHPRRVAKNAFINGAKFQAERMYSEEEVYHILVEHTAFLFAGGKSTLSEWFKQFKKNG